MTCKRLFTIWVRSLNLEHIIPKNNDSQIKFKIKTIKPGKNKKKFDFSVLFGNPVCIINVVELKIIAYGIYISIELHYEP